MTIRLALLALLTLAGCTSAPEPELPPMVVAPSCTAKEALGPSYTMADLQARVAERKAALPEGYEAEALTILRRNPPSFPTCAAALGIDGNCTVVFDVTDEGATANILPVCTSRVFESNLKATVTTWAFEPPGTGPRPAILNRIVFKLDDFDISRSVEVAPEDPVE